MRTYAIATNFEILKGNDKMLVLQIAKIQAESLAIATKFVTDEILTRHIDAKQIVHVHLTLD